MLPLFVKQSTGLNLFRQRVKLVSAENTVCVRAGNTHKRAFSAVEPSRCNRRATISLSAVAGAGA